MKLVDIKCNRCGADLEIQEDTKECFCTYCGAHLLLDDGAKQTIFRDEARLEEAKNRRYELENDVKKKDKIIHIYKLGLRITFVLLIIAIAYIFILQKRVHKATEEPQYYLMRDYVGKNLASFGYTGAGGGRYDTIGEGLIVSLSVIITAEDGSYVNPRSESELSKYIVTAQDPAPNTHIEYKKDEKYSWVGWQSIDSVYLTVKKLE